MTTSPKAPAGDAGEKIYRVRLLGEEFCFDAPAGSPLLQSAERAGVPLQSSCRNGTCRSCLRRVSDGKVAYRIEWPGLSVEEKQLGDALLCVAYPLSDLVID